ncbi:hypothetical protein HCJ39_08300 [Listeria rocourtiae]|uniref:hypothetical protein n=1 Tax=Listeria rocourtiae TaxID=647910 RepID=UPI0016269884|nr:hypothetical protein [Listeria rocourtiae]MBC1434785.1 hypothetical protein [Listeria rocourtiae]MBC1604710.1 hypothetical protein [Listeria rocourtiae]
MLLEAGASIKYVAERLGHSNMEMTLNVYVHPTDTMKKDGMNKFANHLSLALFYVIHNHKIIFQKIFRIKKTRKTTTNCRGFS